MLTLSFLLYFLELASMCMDRKVWIFNEFLMAVILGSFWLYIRRKNTPAYLHDTYHETVWLRPIKNKTNIQKQTNKILYQESYLNHTQIIRNSL